MTKNYIIKKEEKNFTIKKFGQPGLPGIKGEPGNSGKISIGTVTSGDTAQITNTGTNTDAILNFVLPKGDKGDDGASSTLQNVGEGEGLWKETVGSIASLKSILSNNPIVTLNTNENNDTILLDINSREFNNAVNVNLEQINEQITIIQTNLDNLSTNIDNSINGIYEDLSNNVANIYGVIGDINLSIDNINNTINSQSGSINSLSGQITNINNSINTINGQISDLQNRMTTAEGNISTNTGDINSLKTRATNLETRVTTAETNITNNTTSITNNTNAITNLSASIDNPLSDWIAKWGMSTAPGPSAYSSLTYMGFYSTSVNGMIYTQIPSSFVAGKNYYYNPSKCAFSDGNSPSNGTPVGVLFYNNLYMANEFNLVTKSGQRTSNDTQSLRADGFFEIGNPASGINLINMLSNTTSVNYSFIGFGFSGTDTNFQFFIKKKATATIFKLDLSAFTGSFVASDILARQIETPMTFNIKLNANKNGLDLYFKNGKTGGYGSYSLLFSSVANLPLDSTEYVCGCLYSQRNAYSGTADVFDFFRIYLKYNLG